MDDPTCGASHPEHPEITCAKAPHPYGAHLDRTGRVWPGLGAPSTGGSKATRVLRLQQVAEAVRGAGGERRTGAPRTPGTQPPAQPWEVSWADRRPQWLAEAKQALLDVCRAQQTLTTGDVWSRVPDIPERRSMVLVVRHGIKLGWMHETGGVRITGEWTTKDGHSFPLNKIVPVYRSALHGNEPRNNDHNEAVE